MPKKIDIYDQSIDELDILIINIIKKNAGISTSLLCHELKHEYNKTPNPAIILSRLDRLIELLFISHTTEQVGKYKSRRFYINHQGTKSKDSYLEKGNCLINDKGIL